MDKKKCPKSLSEVAWRVDRLVQQPQNMNRFRQVLRDWYNKNAHKPEYQLLPLVEERPYSLTEKYVVLAAVHDSCCRQVESIHPWSKVPKLSTVGVKYFGLMADVPRVLTEDDEPALESFLDSVERDLTVKVDAAETEQKIPPAKHRGIWTRVKGFAKEIYGLTIERITKAWLDKYG